MLEARAFEPEYLRKLDRLVLGIKRARTVRAGQRALGRVQGLGIEPENFKEYAPGDALRFLDWTAFARLDAKGERPVVCVLNLSPVPRYDYRVGMPLCCRWKELVNSDSAYYGGSGVGNLGGVEADAVPWHDQPFSALLTLPPLGAVWFVPE